MLLDILYNTEYLIQWVCQTLNLSKEQFAHALRKLGNWSICRYQYNTEAAFYKEYEFIPQQEERVNGYGCGENCLECETLCHVEQINSIAYRLHTCSLAVTSMNSTFSIVFMSRLCIFYTNNTCTRIHSEP